MARLFIVPPSPSSLPKLLIDATCPGCGHSKGKITCVEAHSANNIFVPMIQHQCQVCGARWHEPTVYKDPKPGEILPSGQVHEYESSLKLSRVS